VSEGDVLSVLLESNMTKHLEQEVTDRAPTTKSPDRAMDLCMVKPGDVTESTLVGDPNEFMSEFGTSDTGFFLGLAPDLQCGGEGTLPR
jgi:hypothetical protein